MTSSGAHGASTGVADDGQGHVHPCTRCGVPECPGDPADCEAHLRARASESGRAYAAAVSSAAEAARAGDSKFASETFDAAEELFAEIESSPYRDLCLESTHRENRYLVQHHGEVAEVQNTIRTVAERPAFDPYEFFVAGGDPHREQGQEKGPQDLVGLGRALLESAWFGSQIADSILSDRADSEALNDHALGLFDNANDALGTLTGMGHLLASLDYHQRSDVLRGIFSAAHRQTLCGVHEAWHRLHPEASSGCDNDVCIYRDSMASEQVATE